MGGSILVITRETDYALRILRSLLDGELHTVGSIAQEELLPQPFAYKIIKKLSKAGLIQIVRGTSGGCRLAASLSQVTLYDLLQAGYQCPWREGHGGCTPHRQLAAIQHKLDQELRAHSLLEILTGQTL